MFTPGVSFVGFPQTGSPVMEMGLKIGTAAKRCKGRKKTAFVACMKRVNRGGKP